MDEINVQKFIKSKKRIKNNKRILDEVNGQVLKVKGIKKN